MIQYIVRISNSMDRFRAATISTNEQDQRGAGLVEYAMLIGLIVLVCIAAVGVLGGQASEPYSELSSQLGS